MRNRRDREAVSSLTFLLLLVSLLHSAHNATKPEYGNEGRGDAQKYAVLILNLLCFS